MPDAHLTSGQTACDLVTLEIVRGAIRAAQAGFLGKKGKLSEAMKELGRLPAADRPAVGAAANKVKQAIEDRVAAKLGEELRAD